MKKRRLILALWIVPILVIVVGSTLYIGLIQVRTLMNTELATVTMFPDGQDPGGMGLQPGGGVIINTFGGRAVRVTTPLSWGDYRHTVRTGSMESGPEGYMTWVWLPDDSHPSRWHFEIDREYRFDLIRTETFFFNTLLRTSYSTNSVFLEANARNVAVAQRGMG